MCVCVCCVYKCLCACMYACMCCPAVRMGVNIEHTTMVEELMLGLSVIYHICLSYEKTKIVKMITPLKQPGGPLSIWKYYGMLLLPGAPDLLFPLPKQFDSEPAQSNKLCLFIATPTLTCSPSNLKDWWEGRERTKDLITRWY